MINHIIIIMRSWEKFSGWYIGFIEKHVILNGFFNKQHELKTRSLLNYAHTQTQRPILKTVFSECFQNKWNQISQSKTSLNWKFYLIY